MILTFHTRNLDQSLFSKHGRSAQHRTGDRYVVFARELSDQHRWRVGDGGYPLGKIGAGQNFGAWDDTGQKAVEQIDMIGLEIRMPLHKQFSDAVGHFREALGIAPPDDFIETSAHFPKFVFHLSTHRSRTSERGH
jgi:hypothetical protein